MRLSKHFTLDELIYSSSAIIHNIDNTPNEQVIKSLTNLAINLLQPIRTQLGTIKVTSGYRCPKLNKVVGGVKSSQHTLGEAADIISPTHTPKELYELIKTLNLPFDQLILEPSWVHISYGPRNRKQCIVISK